MWGNEIEVYVKATEWSTERFRCVALGHQFHRCGKCRKAVVRVWGIDRHDEKCPNCEGLVVVVRAEGERWRR